MPTPPAGANANDPNDSWYSTNGYVWGTRSGRWEFPGGGTASNPVQTAQEQFTQNPQAWAQSTQASGSPIFNSETASVNGNTTNIGSQLDATGVNSTPELSQSRSDMDWWQNYFANAQGPQAYNPDFSNSEQARGWQQQLVQDLFKQASGSLDTRAQQSLAQNTQNAAAQQQALGSSIRGAGGGAGLRAGSMGAGNVERGLAGQQQMLKTQEQQQAQSALAALYAQMRGMDQSQAQTAANAALQNQSAGNDWNYSLAQQGAGNAIESQQQLMELLSAALGINTTNNNIANQYGQSLAQAGGTAVSALSQQLPSQQTSSTNNSYTGPVPAYEPPTGNANEWEDPYA